ncbi:MAG TPA: tRNA (adenosine(37)-N6)-threonylcarbamoyltransferase complex ATPase subunit type 1 TsaE [Candidatus Nitrosotalea sp.]|nr:tRNA (adenosine(37)-N6)-threonylcarbamoyltransferase complex ATPase subunit type 1 TsaE [Candidatus Nitrosotalea sp.]
MTTWREIWTDSAEATEAVGERLARHLRLGDLLLLRGELGAGKTTLVRGLARGLGSAAHVSSPTFQLVKIYPGPLQLAHVDLYRLGADDGLSDLGLDDMLLEGVVVIEWGDRLPAPGAARISLLSDGGDRRRLRLEEAPASWSF